MIVHIISDERTCSLLNAFTHSTLSILVSFKLYWFKKNYVGSLILGLFDTEERFLDFNCIFDTIVHSWFSLRICINESIQFEWAGALMETNTCYSSNITQFNTICMWFFFVKLIEIWTVFVLTTSWKVYQATFVDVIWTLIINKFAYILMWNIRETVPINLNWSFFCWPTNDRVRHGGNRCWERHWLKDFNFLEMNDKQANVTRTQHTS